MPGQKVALKAVDESSVGAKHPPTPSAGRCGRRCWCNTDPELVTDTTNILQALPGNAEYPTPAPTLPVVTAALGVFTKAITKSSAESAACAMRERRATDGKLAALFHGTRKHTDDGPLSRQSRVDFRVTPL